MIENFILFYGQWQIYCNDLTAKFVTIYPNTSSLNIVASDPLTKINILKVTTLPNYLMHLNKV